MRVKRYIVDTMPDAMLKIRGELGADAVILSTKEMKIGGFLGMFQKKKIEVIAASEGNESAPKSKPTPARPSYSAQAPVARQTVPEAYRKSAQMTNASAGASVVGLQDMPETKEREASMQASREFASALVAAASAEAAVEPEREAWPQHLRENPPAAAAQPTSSRKTAPLTQEAKEERLLEEIRQMKMWISQLAKEQGDRREMPEVLTSLKKQLSLQELEPGLYDPWIEQAYAEWVNSNNSLSDAEMTRIIRNALKDFLRDRVSAGIDGSTRIVYIAGPTGVGKTTTIAKLAADQIFRMRKKVGLITADTYRISAIEQLRTYASILNVPLEVVQSPGDVQRAMQRLNHCDLILMDTAGRNYLNELFVAELQSLLLPSEESETYLVLSLTSKTQDMKKIAEHFSKYGLDKLIFTKLDETESVGPIYNLLNEYPCKVSYITNGQNVPDDLLQADQGLLIDVLLGDKRP